MVKLIPGIKLSPAKNAQADEYFRDVLENAKVCPGILTYLPKALAAFRAASEAFHEMVARPLRWEVTPEITEADRELDKALSALRSLMKAMAESPDEQAAKAAKVVLRMSEIDKITGSEQFDEESGKISGMLTTLLGEYREQTEKAGIMPFVLQLKEKNDRLCQLLQNRDLTQGEKGSHNSSPLRAKAEITYRELVFDINSVVTCIDLGLIKTSEAGEAKHNPFAEFTDYMIGHIDRFHREVLHTSSSKPGQVEVEEEVTEDVTEDETTGGGDNTGSGSGDNNGGGSTGGGDNTGGSGSNGGSTGGENTNPGGGNTPPSGGNTGEDQPF